MERRTPSAHVDGVQSGKEGHVRIAVLLALCSEKLNLGLARIYRARMERESITVDILIARKATRKVAGRLLRRPEEKLDRTIISNLLSVSSMTIDATIDASAT